MERRLGELMKSLKRQLRLTSVVVTHDMRLVERVADHVVFLDSGKVIFYGTKEEMERSSVPLVQQFRQLDLIDLNSILRISERQRLAG
jgi:phospholipid/cholesterol/gamma-HCH transport system ATP-binding protein